MPRLTDAPAHCDGVMLAVYVPFGSDANLSTYPDDRSRSVMEHPLVESLREVARTGVPVMALFDRAQDDTWMLHISADDPESTTLHSRWKADMRCERSLRGFLLEAHQYHPKAALVLGLEGHGTGYLPEITGSPPPVSPAAADSNVWQISGREAAPLVGVSTEQPEGHPALPLGFPDLPLGFPGMPFGFPGMPFGFPGMPNSHMPLSTPGLGRALKAARDQGGPHIAVIHLANCFNFSTEVLHTVAPYADAADGVCSIDFFTAGAAYAGAFARLAERGSASALELAQWLCDAQHDTLAPGGGYPTVGGALALSRMTGIANGVDALSDTLLDLLRGPATAARAAALAMIEAAVADAMNYDVAEPAILQTPDQLTDLRSLATALQRHAAAYPAVRGAAETLAGLLAGIKRYGDKGVPALDDTHSVVWDFTEPTLAMNIFLPDPLREGVWDWRAPYYFDLNPTPRTLDLADGSTVTLPPSQPAVIDFLKETNWVEFLKEYHRDTPFQALHVGRVPSHPVFRPGHRPSPAAQAAVAAAGARRPRRRHVPGPVAQAVRQRSAGKDEPPSRT